MAEQHTADQLADARAIIADAERRGFVREGFNVGDPHRDDPNACFLWADADDARDYLAALDAAREPEPDRCDNCGALQMCDCLVYPAAYGRILPEYLP